MWFLLHCADKSESEVLEACREVCDRKILTNVFVMTCDRMRRYQGAWHLETCNMFPGSVILESDEPQKLLQMERVLRSKIGLSKEGTLLTPVDLKTEEYLRELCGESHHLPMSRGVIHGGKTCVMEGPLQGREQMITKIDRHKRLAFLKFSDFANASDLKAGLEITEKTV